MISLKQTFTANRHFQKQFASFLKEEHMNHMQRLGLRYISSIWTDENEEVEFIWEAPDQKVYSQAAKVIEQLEKQPMFTAVRQKMVKYDQADPTHYAVVTAFVTNDEGEILLVRSKHREDTWELPGGRVERDETLGQAVQREVKEESGAEIEVVGVIGIYQNYNKGLIVNMSARYVGGILTGKPGEIIEAKFVKLHAENLSQWITRPHFQTRVIDAWKGFSVPYESYNAQSLQVLQRLNP